MLRRLINWFRIQPEPHEKLPDDPLPGTGAQTLPGSARSIPAVPRRQPEFVEPDPNVAEGSERHDKDRHAPRRSKYIREDSGTHETLKIIDDSLAEPNDDDGIDPYNTGQFNRSRNWDKRSR
ncbi:MAG: hypothetical protein IIA78_04000 [Proteobacteria bacterium]|nr:hypothetical protein [Pseudomonadota bacterium]